MFTYISIFLIVVLLNLFPRKHQILLCAIVCIFLIFFVGLRYEIGADWYNYLFRYQLIQGTRSYWDTFSIAEPGYAFLNYYIRGETPIAYINLICATILCIGMFVYSRSQPYPLLTLATALPYMIFVSGMGYTRQATALGFILIALVLYANKKYFWSIFFIVCSAMFHKTGIIMLILIPLKFVNEKNIKKVLPWIILGSVVFFLMIEKFNSFFEAYGEDSHFNSGGGIYRHVMNVVPALIFFINYKFFKQRIPNFFQIFFFLAVGSIFLLLMSFKLSTFSDRLGQYFAIIQISIWPIFINKFMLRDRLPVSICVVVFYLVFMIYWFQNSEFSQCCWINYKNYLFIN